MWHGIRFFYFSFIFLLSSSEFQIDLIISLIQFTIGNLKKKYEWNQEEGKINEAIESSSSIEIIINPMRQRLSVKIPNVKNKIKK